MLFWVALFHTHLSFDSPLRSGLSLHIEERKKYRFMKILDLHFGALRWHLPRTRSFRFHFQLLPQRLDLLTLPGRFISRHTCCPTLDNSSEWRTHSTLGVEIVPQTSPKSMLRAHVRRHRQKLRRRRPRRLQRGSQISMERCHHEEPASSVRLQSLCFIQ